MPTTIPSPFGLLTLHTGGGKLAGHGIKHKHAITIIKHNEKHNLTIKLENSSSK